MSEQKKKPQRHRKKKHSKKQIQESSGNEHKSDSRQTFTSSGMTNYPDDWEDEDILMRSPSPKCNYSQLSDMSIDRSITALEPLESPRKGFTHFGTCTVPHECTSEASPHEIVRQSLLPPISVTNFPTNQSPKTINNISQTTDGERKCQSNLGVFRQNLIHNSHCLNHSNGGLAFAIGLNDDTRQRKPPHFLEKLPEIPSAIRATSNGSWQRILENKQRIVENRQEEYIHTIAEKGRAVSARRKRAASKLREQLRQSREHIEERLRTKLSIFEENKNVLMRDKLVKIRKMRDRENKTRQRIEKQIRHRHDQQQFLDHLKNNISQQEKSRPCTRGDSQYEH